MGKRITRAKPLMTEAADAPATGPLRTVFSPYSPVEAHIVSGVLQDSGIRCFLSNELIAAVDSPISNLSGGVLVRVQESDAARATQILRERS